VAGKKLLPVGRHGQHRDPRVALDAEDWFAQRHLEDRDAAVLAGADQVLGVWRER
jgi:hypothetical protein